MRATTRKSRSVSRSVLLVVLLAVAVAPFGTDSAAQLRAVQTVPQQSEPEPPKITVPPEFIYTPLSSLSRNLKHALSRDDVTQTMGIVQAILSSEEDSFADISFTENSETVPSLKKLVREYIEQLPDDEFEKYRRRWEIDAEVLLKSAQETGELKDYLQLADQYYFTHSGFEAVDWLATRSLDLGRFLSAARLWNDLIDSPRHRDDVDDQLLFKAALANRLAGQGERASELFERLQKTERGEALTVKLQTYLDKLEREQPLVRTEDTAVSELPESWNFSLFEELTAEQRQVLDQWKREQWLEDLQPLSMPRMGIAAGRFIAVAGYNRMLLLDAETGRLSAQYPLVNSLEKICEEVLEIPLQQNSWTRFSRQIDLHEKIVWNTLAGQVTTDGRYLFVIEGDNRWSEEMPLRPGERIGARLEDRRIADIEDPIPVNRIVALPIPELTTGVADRPIELSPRWTAGEEGAFDGAYFLAPPVHLDGFLYSLIEQKDVLKLVCLDPLTGKLIWSQGITHPGLLLFEDANRRFRSCELQTVGGILVLTTQVGVVVALDPVRRNLEWIYYVGENEPNRAFASGIRMSQISFGYLGFPDRIVSRGRQICIMPRQSAFIHCLNAADGSQLWKVPRHRQFGSDSPAEGDDYLGGIHGETLIVVGEFSTRGLSLSDGRERWSVEHKRIAGIGLQRDEKFYLPLENGTILCVDTETGDGAEISSLDQPASDGESIPPAGLSGEVPLEELTPALPRYGHLLAVGDRCISVGLDSVRAFPLPGRELQFLNAQTELTPELQLRRTLLAGDVSREPIHATLSKLLEDPSNADVRERARRELLEENFARLENDPELDRSILDETEKLVRNNDDRVRLLVFQMSRQMQDRDDAGLLQSLRDLRQLDTEMLFPIPNEPGLSVSLGGWSRIVWDWTHTELSREQQQKFDDFLQGETADALTSGSAAELDRLLRQFPGLIELDPVRLTLARLECDRRNWHQAEMLLLTILKHPSSDLQSVAKLELASMWTHLGLPLRAASLMTESDSFPEADNSTESKALLEQLQSNTDFQREWRKQLPPSRELKRVFFESLPPEGFQSRVEEMVDNATRFFVTAPESPFELVVKRDFNGKDQHFLHVYDRKTAFRQATFPIPDRVFTGSSSSNMLVGHFFPAGCKWQLRGYSLLPSSLETAAWTRSFPEPRFGRNPLSVGPLHPEFCGFRSEETMLVVDPRNGTVIWRRDGLAPLDRRNSAHPGMFGDREVVSCSQLESSNYRHFETFTGREIAFDDALPWAGVFGTVGKNVVAIEVVQDQVRDKTVRRVVVADSSNGRRLLREEYLDSQCYAINDGKLLLITPDYRLKMIDAETLETLCDVPLNRDEANEVLVLQTFEDRTNWYLNIRRRVDHQWAIDPQFSPRQSNFASSTLTPVVDVQGVLIAVDKQTRERRWSRQISPCSIMQVPNVRLPFLLTFSIMTERRGIQRRRLRVEALSSETGNSLGATEDFVPLDQGAQFMQADYDPVSEEIELNGPTYRAKLRFGSILNEIDTEIPLF